ncbi:MAG: hypothetical protein R2873_24635 [Caldilineaceae bacterium]
MDSTGRRCLQRRPRRLPGRRKSLNEAVHFARYAGAYAVTKLGVIDGLAARAAIQEFELGDWGLGTGDWGSCRESNLSTTSSF